MTVEASAPAAPNLSLALDTGISSSDGITNLDTVNVAGLEVGADWQYSTDNGSGWTAGMGSSFTLTAAAYAAGHVRVRQTDLAGNTGTAGALDAVTVDSSAAAPALALATDTGASDGVTNVGMVTVTSLGNGALWEYSV